MVGPELTPQAHSAYPVGHSVITAGGILLAIVGLYLGRDFFIPFTLAILLAFALSPIVDKLRRAHVPRVTAVLLPVTLAFVLMGGLSACSASWHWAGLTP